MVPALKVLVVSHDESFRNAIGSVLELELNLVVEEAASELQALEALERQADIACVLCDHVLRGGSGLRIISQLKTRGKRTPVILMSPLPAASIPELRTDKPSAFLVKPFQMPELTTTVQKVLGLPATPSVAARTMEYLPVKTSTLLRLSPLACDVFVRLSDEKYVRLLQAGDEVTVQDIERYKLKNVSHLYVKSAGKELLLAKLAAEAQAIASGAPVLPDRAYAITKSAHETIHEIYQAFGFDEALENSIKASVELAASTLRQHPEFLKILGQLELDADSYLSSHSIVLAHVAGGLASLMQWGSGATHYKLAMAALVHDLPLKKDEVARLELADDYVVRAPADRVAEYEEHPIRAAELVRKMRDMPPDIDVIVLQHHEQADGLGFPYRHRWPRIGALSALFIIAEKLVTFYAKHGKSAELKDFFIAYSTNFCRGEFEKIFMTMRNSTELGNPSLF